MRLLLSISLCLLLSSCRSDAEAEKSIERDVLITLTKRVSRIEKKLRLHVPQEDTIYVFDSEEAMKKAVIDGKFRGPP